MTGRRPGLILASASPRRRQLLSDAGYDFEIVAPAVEELQPERLTVREATSYNALRKGLAVARAHPGRVVLAADTLVQLDHQLIGKPADHADAARLLRLLSGRSHVVPSGVFITHLHRGRSIAFSVISHVQFKKLSEKMIADYLTSINPLDKAGGYAAQGKGGAIIARVLGSRSNVIGLPLEKTSSALDLFQIRPTTEA
ncbi:MAG: Maf family protein [Chthoniobacterales bacterium]